MPQDPNLYGHRPNKKQKHVQDGPSTLDFAAQMTSLMAQRTGRDGRDGTDVERRREVSMLKSNKSNVSVFGGAKHSRGRDGEARSKQKLLLKHAQKTEDEARELERSRQKMQEKARLYSAMKRGDHSAKDGDLVDFDRKWADTQHEYDGADSSSETDSGQDEGDDGDDDDDDEVIEYVDEYGRTRRGTRSMKEKMERRLRRSQLGAQELETMSARPIAPQNIIHGDMIQTMAFNPDDGGKMEELARKRDRSSTPPDKSHYDADREFRDKGVGFYKFSKDEAMRTKEMESLQSQRSETETRREMVADAKEVRRRQMEARRHELEARKREVGTKRAKKLADSFLNDLASEMGNTTDS